MTLDINDKVRVHTAGGIELNEPSGGWNFGSLAGVATEQESISSNGSGQVPKWLRYATFQELDYATVRSTSDKLLAGNNQIGNQNTLLLSVTTEPGLDRHLISSSMVFALESFSLGEVRPRVFLTVIRGRTGSADNSASYQALCFSDHGEMKGCQMGVTVYTTVNTPGNTAPLKVEVFGRVEDAGPLVNAVDGSVSVLSWHDPQ